MVGGGVCTCAVVQGFSHVSHTGSAYVSIQKVRVQLEDRKRAGFITSKEWNRIMDTKVCGGGREGWVVYQS